VVLVNYWIIPISEENWLVVKETGVYGAPEAARGRHIRDLVKPGDVLIFYVSDWGWGTIADAVLDYNYAVAYYSQSSISPDKWMRVRELLARNPGATWLEKLALRYIHDKLVEFIESTPMKTYRDTYLWLLATQMPIEMRNCTAHDASTAPLLEALSDGCGCEEERVWILGNVTSHPLTVNTTTAQLMWPSLTSRAVVNATVVIAEIAGYPELWQLHNETLGLHLAKPVDDKYLVYYNVYENTVFCDWGRLVRSSGSSA